MRSPTCRARPITSAFEYRYKVLVPLLHEANRHQDQSAELSFAAPTLRFKLGDQEVAMQLESAADLAGNSEQFTSVLTKLRQQMAAEGAGLSVNLACVESLMASKAAQANLEALFQLWHRAVFSSQCGGLILTPAHLVDALLTQLEPYVAQAQQLLAMAGLRLSLGVLAAVEPALQELAELCLGREREVVDRDAELAAAYSRLAYELRSLEALAIRFMEDKRYSRSSLLVPEDLPLLRRHLLQQGLQLQLGGRGVDGADSLEALLWELQEGPPADMHAWEEALDLALDQQWAQAECRLLLTLGPAGQLGGFASVRSQELVEAQAVALEVLSLACIALEVGDRLGTSIPTAAGPSAQQRLMAVAGAAHALLPDLVPPLRAAGSPFLEGLLAGGSSAVQQVEDIERRETRLRLAEAEARARRAEQLVKELQLQAAVQRRAHREVVVAQQQLAMTWLSVMETQVDMSKAQRSCLEEATRELRAAVAHLTVPELAVDISEPPLSSLSSSPATTYRAAVRQDSLPLAFALP